MNDIQNFMELRRKLLDGDKLGVRLNNIPQEVDVDAIEDHMYSMYCVLNVNCNTDYTFFTSTILFLITGNDAQAVKSDLISKFPEMEHYITVSKE